MLTKTLSCSVLFQIFISIKFFILSTILLFSDKFYLACTCTMETLQHPVIVTTTIFVILPRSTATTDQIQDYSCLKTI